MKSKNNLIKTIEKNQTTIMVCKTISHEDALMSLCKSLKKKFKRTCIVNANTPYSTLIEKLKEKNIDYSKFYFVDCVSSSFLKQVRSNQCTFISSPHALTELAIALSNLPKEIDLVILDSFSGLAFYNDEQPTLRFLNSVTSRFRKKTLKAVYFVVGETKKEILADLSLFADNIVEI